MTVAPSEHPNRDLMESLWAEGKRGTEIAAILEKKGLPPVKVSTLSRYGQRYWNNTQTLKSTEDLTEDDLETIISVADAEGLKVKKFAVNKKNVFVWERNSEGKNVQVPKETTTHTIEFQPSDDLRLSPATIPTTINVAAPVDGFKNSSRSDKIGLAISLPDMQIGYFRDKKGVLHPTQDEQAIDVAFQIVNYLSVTEGINYLIYQGDNADFPEFSHHRSAPGFIGHTQATIDRIGGVIATGSAAAPEAEGVYITGNHEARLVNKLTDTIPGLVGLSRAGSDEAVLSLDYLCRLSEHGVQLIEDYPNGEFWVNQGTRFIHGSAVSSGKGATAAGMLSRGISTIFGHIHRQELVWGRTKNSRDLKQVFAGSAGTLSRINGNIPSSRTGVSASGKAPNSIGTEDWQQGIMLVYYEIEGENSWPEIVSIENGRAYFRGQLFETTVDEFGNPLK